MPLQIVIVCRGIHWRSRAKLSLLRGSELGANPLRDGVRHLRLKIQNISQIPIIGLCPKVLVSGCLNELGGNTHSLV